MARWIDASPAQRWHQYQKPADRALLAEAPAMEEAFKVQIRTLWQKRQVHHRASIRRIRAAIRDLRSYRRGVADARKRLQTFG